MVASKRQIESDPATPIGEAMKQLADGGEDVEIRVGAHLYLVHRRDETPSTDEPEGNVHLVLAAARAFRDEIGEDVDFDAMRTRIETIREHDRQRPIPKID
jgi:hypothetical protein